MTTRALGEEGSEAPVPNLIDLEKLAAAGGLGMMATTQAVGEEEGDIRPELDLSTLTNRPGPGVAVTRALGEMPDGSINPAFEGVFIKEADLTPLNSAVTTMALGEAGNPPLPPELDRPPVAVTQALGEQPGDVQPLTRAVPENGGDPNPPATLYPQPNYPTRPGPMNPGGLASLVQLPMFQEFAQKLQEAHPEQSALFSQMFMGGMQQPMMRPPMFGMGFGGGFSPYMGMMGMGSPMMMPPPMMYGGMPMGGGYGGYGGGYGGYGMGSPFMGGGYGYGMGLGSFYQQQQAPQPSTYAPPQQQQQPSTYAPPQQPSPFGGAMRGYYA